MDYSKSDSRISSRYKAISKFILKDSDDILNSKLFDEFELHLRNGLKGIEKESLRIRDGLLSNISHDYFFGSALFNRFITTDFSESQIEFITRAYQKPQDVINALMNQHHFCQLAIEDEYLWPLSMPFKFDSEDQIPIAKYGTSNMAILKEVYREGLSRRYGKVMQTISGIHFNYSLPEEIWTTLLRELKFKDEKEIKKIVYFRALRNIERMNWLLLYLFGCSPVISRNFFNKRHHFIKHKTDDYYLPFSTSLRMSDLGYNNNNQSKIDISLNSFEEYYSDLILSTKTESRAFKKLSNKRPLSQLNPNLLQIEDEYYSNCRPKSEVDSAKRQLTKMKQDGVDYIELRSIDLNPFSSIGINNIDAKFLEAFLVYCSLSPSPLIKSDERPFLKKNNIDVALNGRKSDLKLINNGQEILLKDWAREILNNMEPLFQAFSFTESEINIFKERIDNPEKTPSGEFLERFLKSGSSYYDYGKSLGERHKLSLLSKNKMNNDHWKELNDETFRSIREKKITEKNKTFKFEYFLKEFMSST